MPPSDYPQSVRDVTQLFFDAVEIAMDNERITDPIFRCMLLAMIEQESMGGRGPSRLALEHKNLFGFKQIDGLPTVTFPANEFETEPQTYTEFPSFERCLQSGVYSIFKSEFYERARLVAKRSFVLGWRDGGHSLHRLRIKWCESWLAVAAKTWCPVNPAHGPQVKRTFELWLQEYAEGGRVI